MIGQTRIEALEAENASLKQRLAAQTRLEERIGARLSAETAEQFLSSCDDTVMRQMSTIRFLREQLTQAKNYAGRAMTYNRNDHAEAVWAELNAILKLAGKEEK